MSALERPKTDPAAPEEIAGMPVAGWASRVSPKRSLTMMACGAVLGLAIAGFGLFTAKGTTGATVPAEDVALVNQKPILMSDYVAQLEAETGAPFSQSTAAQRRKTLDDMIREELFVQRGLELDFPATDPDTRSALVAAVEQQVVADVTTQQPADADLRAYYERHKENYASDGFMTVRELVLPGPVSPAALAKAREAAQALRSGAAPDTVASRYGLKPSGRMADGEEFYFAAKIHLGDPLFAVAEALPTGAVSEPQPAGDGVHILQMVKNSMPVPRSFEEALPNVMFDFKKEAQDKLEKADEGYLRSKADILIAKAYR